MTVAGRPSRVGTEADGALCAGLTSRARPTPGAGFISVACRPAHRQDRALQWLLSRRASRLTRTRGPPTRSTRTTTTSATEDFPEAHGHGGRRRASTPSSTTSTRSTRTGHGFLDASGARPATATDLNRLPEHGHRISDDAHHADAQRQRPATAVGSPRPGRQRDSCQDSYASYSRTPAPRWTRRATTRSPRPGTRAASPKADSSYETT